MNKFLFLLTRFANEMYRYKYKFLIIFLFLLSGAFGFLLSLYVHRYENVSHLETYHYPATFVRQLEGDRNAGKKIFQEFCAACHAENPSIQVNAPRINDAQYWKALRKLGISALLKITIQGKGAMPARGGCFECSDEQLEMTIEYILNNSIR